MGPWLDEAHLAGFAPAFTLSQGDSECSHNPPIRIVKVVRANAKKKDRQTIETMSVFSTVLTHNFEI
jgi:hypothetical protein